MLSVHVVKGYAMSAFSMSISLLEYQAMDAASEVKNEYFRGEVFAMAGGTPEHSLICANFIGESRAALKGKPCVVYTSDLRIMVDRTGLYTYPDSAIICGELLRESLQLDDRLLLESVGIEIELREIYRGSVFSA